MQVYDFTTLYTNLNLDIVRDSLNSLIDITFSEKNKYVLSHTTNPSSPKRNIMAILPLMPSH